MTGTTRIAILVLALSPLVLPTPARADFYSLDGRFQCLDRPGAVCADLTPSPVLASRVEPPKEPAPPVVAHAEPPAPPPRVVKPVDPVLAIAERIEQRRADENDLAILHAAKERGDGRATELLAWCALQGIGMNAEPVQAYLLYGEAADSGVPNARVNQALVYERSLDSAERQSILDMLAKARPTPVALSANAAGDARDVR